MQLFQNRKVNRLALVAFVAAALLTLWRAVLPDDGGVGFIPWDKAKHFIAFYVLTALAVAALPTSRFWRIGAVLLGFGIGIEVVQALVGRDAALGDIVADACGIGALFGPIVLRAWSTTRPEATKLEIGRT